MGGIRAKRKGKLGVGRRRVGEHGDGGSIVFSNLGGNLSSPESLAAGGRGQAEHTLPSLHTPNDCI